MGGSADFAFMMTHGDPLAGGDKAKPTIEVVEGSGQSTLHEGPLGNLRGNVPSPSGRAVGTPPEELLSGGSLKVQDLMDIVPTGTDNTFIPSKTIVDGYKYSFSYNGVRYEVKIHSPDAVAASKFPGSNSGKQWTAQVKVNNKLLGSDGKYYNKPSDLTHIPVDVAK
jgi:filamentous hemagglutinin